MEKMMRFFKSITFLISGVVLAACQQSGFQSANINQANGPITSTLEDLVDKSAFVSKHYKYLKDKNARSVYASTNPVCPSTYWMSFTTAAASTAKSKWKIEVERKMTAAGFNPAVIQKCVNESGFLYENYQIYQHPKHKSYNGYYKTGVVVWMEQGDYQVNTMPVFVQTNDYTGNQTFRIYDQNFKQICKFTSHQWNFNGSCSKFGRMKGRGTQDGNRFVVRWQSGGTKAALFTERTVKYAIRNF